jgi:hypothetical protein
LKEFLKEEELLKEDVLVKSGFLLRKYSLRLNKINIEALERLKKELKNVVAIESDISYNLKSVKEYLKEIEIDYRAYHREKLHIDRILIQYMNNVFYLSQIMINRIYQLTEILETGEKLHKANLGIETKRILDSLEKTGNQILKFLDLLSQLQEKVEEFEKVSYNPDELMYGRAMSKEEARKTISNSQLTGSPKRREEDLIGVFFCTPSVVNRMDSMSDDERKNLFSKIGVVGGVKIIYFKTRLKPVAGPIPQSNGLIEYKFPKGTHIKIAA